MPAFLLIVFFLRYDVRKSESGTVIACYTSLRNTLTILASARSDVLSV